MSLTQFDHGYWYTTELKRFAAELGIPSVARLRKDELEHAIRRFLSSGKTEAPAPKPVQSDVRSRPRDVDLGLRLDSRIIRYTNDPTTKSFLEQEARKLAPAFRRRSGAMYRFESMEGEATVRRSRAHVSGPGVGVSSPDPIDGPICPGSAWPLCQLPQRFHDATPWSRQGRSHRGVARAEGDVLPEDLSRLGPSTNAVRRNRHAKSSGLPTIHSGGLTTGLLPSGRSNPSEHLRGAEA